MSQNEKKKLIKNESEKLKQKYTEEEKPIRKKLTKQNE